MPATAHRNRPSLTHGLIRMASTAAESAFHGLPWLLGILALTMALCVLLVWADAQGGRVPSLPATNTTPAPPQDTQAQLTPIDALWQSSQVLQVGDLRLRVLISSSDLSFELGEVQRLRLGSTDMPASELISPVMLRSLADCKALVVLGTASQEGQAHTEALRAQRRSDWVQYQLWRSGQVGCPLYTLNLGKAWPRAGAPHRPGGMHTEHQRRLIVLTLLEAPAPVLADEVQMRQSLRQALGQLQGLPVNVVQDYPLFDLARRH